MIEKLTEQVLRQRFVIVVLGILLLAYGIYATLQLPVAAFPDVTNIQVQIYTESPGHAAVEVEKLITFPIESVMNGLPDVTEVRSISKTGLSVVTVIFKDNVDIYFARQLTLERLQVARERIPKGLGNPEMGPITTGLGQVYKYILVGDGYSDMELRTLNDWLVKFMLRTVPGVTDVLSFGGSVRQYQVNMKPNLLLKYDLTLDGVAETISQNNRNAGGWYLDKGPEQFVVRGEGLISGGRKGLTDIENIVLKVKDGTPVFVRHIGEVEYGAEIRQGAVTMNGKGEVVAGIVLQLIGANTKEVISRIKKKVMEIQKALPDGVKIVPVYDQADLVEKAIGTVTSALSESAVLIIIVLFLFLGNVRCSLIVVLSIPLSMMVAFIMMRQAGLSANLMSLGGLAIAIGMIVDGSIVMVENIFRHLGEVQKGNQSRISLILRATREVTRPVFFAVLIIVIVFLPLFTLQGVEGKMFKPLAFTISFAMLGALIVALTIAPVLTTFLLAGKTLERKSLFIRYLKRAYVPALKFALKHRLSVAATVAFLVLASLALIPFIGKEFVPELEEGTLTIRVTANPSISLGEAIRMASKLENKLLKYPEVNYAFSQIGRAELGGCPENISNTEIFVGLKTVSEWQTAKNRQELVNIMAKDLMEYPGILLNFSQPIATRVDELISGIRAQIAIKLFGEDLKVLEEKGREIEAIIKQIPGASDVQMERISGEAQLVVKVKRDEMARFGINVDTVMGLVADAIGGKMVTEVIEGQKRFAVYLRLKKEFRSDIETIKNLLVPSPGGIRVPLSRVADVMIVEGLPIVSREDVQRRVVVQCNVRGRDMGGFVQAGMKAIEEKVRLPAGYYVTWGGQFENQIRAQRTLMIVLPLAVFLIFTFLYMSFNSLRNVMLIILNVPFALVGGIFALLISGLYLSVPSSIGFIALFGVAVQNGVVMVSYFNQLRREGLSLDEAIFKGSVMRLRPVLMTALTTALGLMPLMLSSGVGSEVQRPLAVVVVGGLVSSTLLTLVVLPTLYRWFEETRIEF